jgi:hypothetical protein
MDEEIINNAQQIWKGISHFLLNYFQVKVPKFLAEHISAKHRDGKQIGTLIVAGEDISLHLNDPKNDNNIPQNFRVKITKEEMVNE